MALPLVGIASLVGRLGIGAAAKRFGKRAVRQYLSSRRNNEKATDAWEGLKSKKLNIEEAEPLREKLKFIARGGREKGESLFQKNIDAVKEKTRPMMEKVLRGEATPSQYDKLVDSLNPIKPFAYLPKITSPREMLAALKQSGQRAKIVGDKVSIKDGEKVGARLDIPAYSEVGQWVNAIHDLGPGKKPKGYSAFTYLKAGKDGKDKVKFGSHSEHALRIAEGKQAKFPFAQVEGYYENISPKKMKNLAEEALKDSLGKNPTWTQVSFNPLRSGRYLNRIDPDKIIEEADEYIQVGPLVLAKNARMVSRSALNAGKYNKKINYREKLGLTPDEDMKGIFAKLKKDEVLDKKLFTFEEGGIVDLEPNMEDEMMDREMMDRSAQELASKGRYGDSMLVHMAPEEVAGIASLGGVSMNPETGLPEMFKFKDFIKFAAPIALSVALPAYGAAAAQGLGAGTAAVGGVGGQGLAGFLSKTAGKAILSGLGSGIGSLMTGSNRDEALASGMTAGLTYGLASKAGQAMQGQQQQVLPGAKQQIIRETGAQSMDPSSVNVAPKPTMADALSRNQSSAVGGASQPASIVSGRFADPSGGEYGNLMKQAAENQGFYTQSGDATMFKPDLSTPPKPSMYARTVGGLGGYGNIVPGVLAGGAGAMAGMPRDEEEERRKRKEIELARPYSDPVTYPGMGYGSGEYGYFGPNYGLYAKEGGHIKQMQEGGAVDTTTGADIPMSAFSGDLMSFAPAIAGGANYGIGAMPTAMDSSEYNYGVAPNMGGYDYRSFIPADYQSAVGAGSAPSVVGSGEQVTGNPNVLEDIKKTTKSAGVGSFKPYTKWTSVSKLGMRANDPARSNRMFRDVVSGYTASGEPIYTRETKYRVAGTGVGTPYNVAQYKYGTMPIKFQEGGITSLPQTEGQVEGNGDGMSDEVYGDIENQQEVALSKDEFIVPADVVSGLGNGSSNAGASKLYEMMARVRKARTGKESQPEEIEAEEFMPA
jgi:hypothetical protein